MILSKEERWDVITVLCLFPLMSVRLVCSQEILQGLVKTNEKNVFAETIDFDKAAVWTESVVSLDSE